MADITEAASVDANPRTTEPRRMYARTGSVVPAHCLMGYRYGTTGLLCEPMTARADLLCLGIALSESLTAAASNTSTPIEMQAGRVGGFNNSETSPVTEAHFRQIVYAEDNFTLRADDGDTGGGPLYSPAGIYEGPKLDDNGQTYHYIWIPEYLEIMLAKVAGWLDGASASADAAITEYTVDGAVTSVVSSLAAFTVAGHDGNTFTAGQIAFLLNQASPQANGPYVVGTVALGVAPLTRPTWWAAASAKAAGTSFFIRAGTTGKGLRFYNSAAIAAVDTTNPAFKLADPLIMSRPVTGLVTSNIADLTAVAVSGGGRDGNTYVENDVICAVAQSTPAQDGPYLLGAVNTTAPAQRPVWWFTGMIAPPAFEVVVDKGTIGRGTKWYSTLAGPCTVGTSSPAFYPREWAAVSAAMTGTPGTITVSNLWIHPTTGIHPTFSRETTGGTPGHVSAVVTAGAGNGSVALTSTGNETSTFALAGHN